MVFKCQEDSFLKEFQSVVVSCEPAQLKIKELKTSLSGFNVILEDTVIFPEGGGQPCDFGTLNGHPVRSVIRKGPTAIHFVESKEIPFKSGEEVQQIVDWDRRIDHMQQHSGQHLITAIFEQDLKFNTKSWWLGSETSYIELDAKDVSQDQLDYVEKKCNDIIFEAIPVSVKIYDRNDPNLTDDVTRATRGLPEDVGDMVRIVQIGNIDSNMCCGTHVRNTSQLQMVKLLNVEKAKQKLMVHFLVGKRILAKVNDSFHRELILNNLLNGGPSSHVELVKKLQMNLKVTNKSLEKCLKDIAAQEAEKLSIITPKPKYFSLHRNGAEGDFLPVFLRELKVDGIFLFITFNDGSDKGKMYLQGDPEDITTLGSMLCEIMDGKGSAKKDKFQAKINNLKPIKLCEEKIAEHFKNKLN